MNKKTLISILVGVVVIFLAVVISYRIPKQEENTKKEFQIETPREFYNKHQSSLIGYPFEVKCPDEQTVKISITNGFLLLNEKKLEETDQGDYNLKCNQTVYWNYDDWDGSKMNISFTLEEWTKRYSLQKDSQENVKPYTE